MNDHIYPYWDEANTPHTASGKSLADRDEIEFHSLNKEEEKNLVEFLQSDDYQDWQKEIMEQEKIRDSKFGETKENKFYGLVKVKKADIISPSEAQLMAYYIDYGYKNIEDVIKDYGQAEMLREWYINTNWTTEFQNHREEQNIHWIDWGSEFEDVEIISEKEWKRLWEQNYGF